MNNSDDRKLRASDVWDAIGLLTRLPVTSDGTRGARAAWAWPLAGVAVALIAVCIGWVTSFFGVPAPIVAALVLAVQITATGALHEDGLADCADGFWGGMDRERRLTIMKDSRIGAYGVVALVLSLLIRWSALTLLVEADALFAALIATAALSRVPMVVLMSALPPARADGLSRLVGRPDQDTALLAGALAATLALVTIGFSAIPAALAIAVVAFALGRLALSRIGGQTGDVLGASQQLGEISALIVLVTLL
ncbi:MAG: adenosylcobinamide-GDP ribazoletransferase [Marinosulfonomonas sp.]